MIRGSAGKQKITAAKQNKTDKVREKQSNI